MPYTKWQIDYLKTEDIPRDLISLLMPRTEADYEVWKQNRLKFLRRAHDRKIAIALQKQYSLPFRPNMTVRDTWIQIRLKCLRDKIQRPIDENEFPDN